MATSEAAEAITARLCETQPRMSRMIKPLATTEESKSAGTVTRCQSAPQLRRRPSFDASPFVASRTLPAKLSDPARPGESPALDRPPFKPNAHIVQTYGRPLTA